MEVVVVVEMEEEEVVKEVEEDEEVRETWTLRRND